MVVLDTWTRSILPIRTDMAKLGPWTGSQPWLMCIAQSVQGLWNSIGANELDSTGVSQAIQRPSPVHLAPLESKNPGFSSSSGTFENEAATSYGPVYSTTNPVLTPLRGQKGEILAPTTIFPFEPSLQGSKCADCKVFFPSAAAVIFEPL